MSRNTTPHEVVPAPARPSAAAARHDAPAVVLDTNAVLDWLVFGHPACNGWTERFADRQVRWIASAAMRVELAHVLGRPAIEAWQPRPVAVWAAWDRLVEMLGDPAPAGAAARLRCTDPDDQKFVDLALASQARWLVSRDRAVLRLGRRARAFGLEVLTPDAWTAASRA